MVRKGPHQGKPSGDAFAELLTLDDYQKALDCHKKEMGTRYIEVFPCKKDEMDWILSRNDTGPCAADQSCGFVRLRGLPFGCTKEDIRIFFKGTCCRRLLFSQDSPFLFTACLCFICSPASVG